MTSYFIKKSVFTICLNLVILLLGVFSISKMSSEFIPSVKVPAVAVVIPTTLHSTENIMQFVTIPIEKEFLKTELVERVETRIENQKNISVVYCKWNYSPEECLQRSRQIVDGVKKPSGVLDPIFILHQPSLSPIFRIVLYGAKTEEITELLKQPLQDIERISGVASVRLQGSSPKISKINIPLEKAVRSAVSIENILSSAAKIWSLRELVSIKGKPSTLIHVELDNITDIESMPIQGYQKNSIQLRTIAKVESMTTPSGLLFGSDQKAVIIELLKSPGSDTLSIVDNVKDVLNPFFKKNSKILSTVIYDESVEIRNSQQGVLSNFAIGIILNSIVLIIFLGSFAGVIIASAVFPTSILGTLYILNSMDISLNIFSLNGFSLAAGMITDASTVVLESVMRRIQNKENLFTSTINGTKDVMLGIVAGTASSAAVMVPICLQSGMSAKLFSDLGITLIGTQLLTLISVFTLVPFLCFKFLNPNTKPSPVVGFAFSGTSFIVKSFSEFCSNIFIKSGANKILMWSIPACFSFLCLGSMFFLPPSELLPVVSSDTYLVSIPQNRAALKNDAEKLTQQLASVLGQQDKIEWSVTTVDEDMLTATIKTKNGFSSAELQKVIADKILMPIEKISFFPVGPTPPAEAMNYDGLVYISDNMNENDKKNLLTHFCQMPGIYDCNGIEHYSSPRLILSNKSIVTEQFLTNPIDLAIEMNARMSSINLSSLADLALPNDIILSSQYQGMVSDSPLLGGQKNSTAIMSLGSFFDKKTDLVSRSVFTQNLGRFEPLFFKLKKMTLGDAKNQLWSLAKELKIDTSLILPVSTIASMDETFSKVLTALMISLILNFGILMLQFGSIKQTLIVMYAIPLSLGGAVVGLVIMHETVNVGVLVGFMLLGGIVVNNGILLFESLNQLLKSGVSFEEAMLTSIQVRTRPILMTSCATVFGMMPTLLFESSGQELYRGMAIVNIFGMTLGTFLTLLVLPLICRIAMGSSTGKLQESSPTKG
ncbi:MAG: efflux RND transporter permease subunit [Pseudobdellovibrionaceae bacterium]